ncbi:indole-3-acetic acid-induced protein ARG7-like [Abrus precatorius]|uniref:Indole-3-acetic acid-induced protein ARG7-like n=1 Tax=Abrus precatorius TaxID=3816 RepID=A0A8B8KIS5_ABRPR|nr:indole-3-acetic acid-induced protein ARG7-like [Abrus precatorius]
MDLVKKCKRVLGRSKRLHPENNGSGSYGKLTNKKKKKTPHGCLCVYVGPERQRFVIKIKIANHPLFKTLLDAAEREYGYRNDGPLWLPCDVDLFCEALREMETGQEDMGCTFPMGQSHRHSPTSVLYSPLSYSSNPSCDVDYELFGW